MSCLIELIKIKIDEACQKMAVKPSEDKVSLPVVEDTAENIDKETTY
jgi:hypothetical protein